MTSDRPPHVVYMPGNDVLVDARVLKYIASADSLGLRVTGIGVVRKGYHRSFALGNAHILVEPVPIPQTAATTAPAGRPSLGVVVRDLIRPDADTHDRLEARRRATAKRRRGAARAVRERKHGALAYPVAVFHQGQIALERAYNKVLGIRVGGTPEPVSVADITDRDQAIAHYRKHPELSRWREVLPNAQADEESLGRLLDELRPDIIHVHDVFMLGVAVNAADRAAASGRDVKLVYDAHEYIAGVAVVPALTIGAYCDLEREFVPRMDRVITVSEPLAGWLTRDYGLDRAPDVVLNAPMVGVPPDGFRDLRDVVGLAPDVPLMVYGGGVNRARGVQTAVAALAELPDMHLALVTNRPNGPVTRELLAQARSLGVLDRFHVAPFVRPEYVTHYFRRVTIGLSTLLHAPNHDVALTNKFCEYLLAGIPIITSDTPAQADIVAARGLGGVYIAGDVEDLVRAVRELLPRVNEVRDRIAGDAALRHEFSWAAQVETIRDVYADLLGALPEQAWTADATKITHLEPRETTKP
ncbi:glycosyltransferase family 4 protein [Occultella gossypii]|uniref:Glycosyltransferase family 4 protein n=1 Tax=Occultella gossypii TaxID=2800820 RepID=A0ABS7S9M3_9MICO|nr:glycosyltransferase family 4 protein [Occultella gossypii]MBZ2196450.1 glycosyltransferase family 4 protein [Occultella gossypii]